MTPNSAIDPSCTSRTQAGHGGPGDVLGEGWELLGKGPQDYLLHVPVELGGDSGWASDSRLKNLKGRSLMELAHGSTAES